MHYIYLLLNSALLLAVCTNLLPYRLKHWQMTAVFVYLIAANHFTASLGWLGPYITVGGVFLLIFLSNSAGLLNVCFSAFGYLFYVVLRQIYLISAKALLGIKPPQMHREHLLAFTAFCLVTVGLITGLIGWVFRKKNKINLLSVSKNLLVCILLYLLLCTCMFIFNSTYAKRIGYPPHIVGINSLLFGVFFLFSALLLSSTLSIWKKDSDTRHRLEQQAQMAEYTKTLEFLYQSMRSFRHDYINILSTMQGYMMDNDMEGLKSYFQKHILAVEKKAVPANFEVGKLSRIELPEIKGILYNKIIYALSLGLRVHLNIPNPITRITMNSMDLCRILGILLDNAIEASQNSKEKQIDLLFLQDSSIVSMVIGNTCQDLTIPLPSLPNPGATTKGEGRGMGLYTVAQILSGYPTVSHTTTYNDHYFEQRLENL